MILLFGVITKIHSKVNGTKNNGWKNEYESKTLTFNGGEKSINTCRDRERTEKL